MLSTRGKQYISSAVAALVLTGIMINQAAGFEAVSFEGNNPTINLSVEGTWRSGTTSTNTPAGPVYDPRTERIFVGSDDRDAIDVIDVSIPTNPTKIRQINLGGNLERIAFSSEGILAVSRLNAVRLFTMAMS